MKNMLAALLLGSAIPAILSAAPAQDAVVEEAAIPEKVVIGTVAAINVPQGWTATTGNGVYRLAPPVGRLRVAITEIELAADSNDAAAQAWARVDPDFSWSAQPAQELPASDGWDAISVIAYDIAPAEQQVAQSIVVRSGNSWIVLGFAGPTPALGLYGADLNALVQSLQPTGYEPETFANLTANTLDAAKLEEFTSFIEDAMEELGIPGVGLALVQDGQVLYEGGLGVRDLESGRPVDEHTRFMVASNTKGMTTLLLATLVDEGLLDWDRPVIDYLPDFRLGDEETTRRILIRHLVCACTGLPRKDMQWQFNTADNTPASDTFSQLAATMPTSEFGETFQYNNLMASAAGYLAARVLYPEEELGTAYDRAMQDRVFGPLAMNRTDFDTDIAGHENWARPYDTRLDGAIASIDMAFNRTIHPYRPAGGAWSTAHDMARYVLNELELGAIPGSDPMVSAENLLVRRTHNVQRSAGQWYGMGLVDDVSSGVSVIEHGGGLFGYKSGFFAIPSADVGLVILTNADSGSALTRAAKRKLLELLYDGESQAGAMIESFTSRSAGFMEQFRAGIDYPVVADQAEKLVGRYHHDELGVLNVTFSHDRLELRTTSIWSEAATSTNEDGTLSMVSISPGVGGFEWLLSSNELGRTLTLDDGQHQYVFEEIAS